MLHFCIISLILANSFLFNIIDGSSLLSNENYVCPWFSGRLLLRMLGVKNMSRGARFRGMLLHKKHRGIYFPRYSLFNGTRNGWVGGETIAFSPLHFLSLKNTYRLWAACQGPWIWGWPVCCRPGWGRGWTG